MFRRILLISACLLFVSLLSSSTADAQERGFGRVWGGGYRQGDWDRFYHYPYVFYPHNYWGPEYYQSSNSLYHRYPQEMRVPVYLKSWHNFYPMGQRYHSGSHFMTDVF